MQVESYIYIYIPHSASYNIMTPTTSARRVSALVGHRKRPPVQVTAEPGQLQHHSNHHICHRVNALYIYIYLHFHIYNYHHTDHHHTDHHHTDNHHTDHHHTDHHHTDHHHTVQVARVQVQYLRQWVDEKAPPAQVAEGEPPCVQVDYLR